MRHENQHWDNIRAMVEIITAGAGQTGLSPTVKIRRSSDGQWWDGAAWGGTATQVPMNEPDSTNLPGFYAYAIPGGGLTYSDGIDGYIFYIEESVNSLIETVRVVPFLQSAWDDLETSHTTAGTFGANLQEAVSTPAALADAVWDEPLAGHTTAGTAGKILGDTSALPTAGQMADAVWDEPIAGHNSVGSTGEALNNVPTAADNADAVWDEAAGDHNTAGTMGEAQNLAASGLTAADIADAVWDEVASDHATQFSMGYLMNVTAGLLQMNHRFKSPNYDANGRLLDVVLSLFHNSSDADADSGSFASITLEFTYDGDGNLATILGKD
jgi:hypothetical protein